MKKKILLVGFLWSLSGQLQAEAVKTPLSSYPEVALYTYKGNPGAYISQEPHYLFKEDDPIFYIYAYEGKVLGYLREDAQHQAYSVYECSTGTHVGWFKNGWMHDLRGFRAGLTRDVPLHTTSRKIHNLHLKDEPHKFEKKLKTCATPKKLEVFPNLSTDKEEKISARDFIALLEGPLQKTSVKTAE